MIHAEELEHVFRELRSKNARRVNLLRFIGTLALMAVTAVMVFGYEDPGWGPAVGPTAFYLAVALVLLVGGGVNPRFLWLSRFAIPVLDMPILFTIQWMHLHAADAGSRGEVSEFSVALFVCLLLLSAFTLNWGQLLVSLGLAIGFELVLQARAEVGIGSQISSTLVLSFVTWTCFYAGRNRLRLAEGLAEANARRARLQQYFSPGVAELLEDHEEDDLSQGLERELTIVFADIRGFTALSENLAGREVIELLNAYHSCMVAAVFRHGGTLDKYLGDGLMVYFNAPVEQRDHAARAMRCAMAMESELAALNITHRWQGGVSLEMGIGVHTGHAIVGDIGAPHRREFTAIGLAVNIASHLEQMTKVLGVGVLVSEATATRVGDGVMWNEVGDHPVPGCVDPLRLLTPGTRLGSAASLDVPTEPGRLDETEILPG